jgi:hypothetical protein
VFFVFSFLQQQAASDKSGAFSKCSGLDGILQSLADKGEPTVKPQAIKRKHGLLKSGGGKKAAKVATHPTAGAVKVQPRPPKVAAPVATPKPPKEVAPAADRQVKTNRNNVTCRAYKKALRESYAATMPEEAARMAARAAHRKAGEQWDREQAVS